MDRLGPAVAAVLLRSLAGQRAPARLVAGHPAARVVGPQHAAHRLHGGGEAVLRAAHRLEQRGVVEGDRRLSGEAGDEGLLAIAEAARLGMAEQQRAERRAGARDHRQGEVAAHRQVALRHAAEAAVARIGQDVVAAHRAVGPEGRGEQVGGAGQPEAGEALQRRPGEAEQVPPLGRVGARRDALEQRAVGRAGEPRRRLDHRLPEALPVEFAAEREADPVHHLEALGLLAQGGGGALALGSALALDLRRAGELGAHRLDLGRHVGERPDRLAAPEGDGLRGEPAQGPAMWRATARASAAASTPRARPRPANHSTEARTGAASASNGTPTATRRPSAAPGHR